MKKREIELRKLIDQSNTKEIYNLLRYIKARALNLDTLLTTSALPCRKNYLDLERTIKIIKLLKGLSLKGFKEFAIYHPTIKGKG